MWNVPYCWKTGKVHQQAASHTDTTSPYDIQRRMHSAITCNRCLATEVFIERLDTVLIKRSYAYKKETGYITFKSVSTLRILSLAQP